MELTRVEMFKADTSKDLPNIKELEGQTIKPVASRTTSYEDGEGKEHSVLIIKDGKSGVMYRTEVGAFIDKFLAYDATFGDLPDEEKPEITITSKKSKRGYSYVNFDVVDQ